MSNDSSSSSGGDDGDNSSDEDYKWDITSDADNVSGGGGGGGGGGGNGEEEHGPELVEVKSGSDDDEDSALWTPVVSPLGTTETPLSTTITAATTNDDEAGPSRPDLASHFISMGFSKPLVAKAIAHNGDENMEAILETLLTYTAIDNSPSDKKLSHEDGSSSNEEDILDDDSWNEEDILDDDSWNADEFQTKDDAADYSRDTILSTLMEMGFPIEEASLAINRCGPDASFEELADSIRAAEMAEEFDGYLNNHSIATSSTIRNLNAGNKRKKDNRGSHYDVRKNRCHGELKRNAHITSSVTHTMVGFSLPNEPLRIRHRNLPVEAKGPPYFYYENVALAPKGVWETMSRFLFDIEPEFVDSKYFCAAARKRGYIHNLPLENRFPLLPLAPRTIEEALPHTTRWWPKWDPRIQLNCLLTCTGSSRLTDRIRSALVDATDPPSQEVQRYVLNECRKWNLVWVGKHRAAPLEPDEIEMLLGFPRDHTRGGGISRTDRFKSLGNSFQVDTVAYHLSVLKGKFPKGMNVLSLFSGIGGAEVALHRLGIPLKTVVSVEASEVNRNIIRGWWDQTGQPGDLIEIDDVRQLNGDKLEEMIVTTGGFDLVIGGSPCNNLAGTNRHHRDGLEGTHSSLFYDYFRILDIVKAVTKKVA